MAGAAAALTEVQRLAGVAAAAAYASTAAIPVVGPALAPAAAASALAAVEAFGSMAALATGAWNIPSDMAANLHAGEMVIPASFASGMRSAMTGSNGGGNGPTLNYAPNVSGGGVDLASLMRAQAKDFKSYIWNTARNGGMRLAGRPI